MRVKSLELENFRNYAHYRCDGFLTLNVLVGPNGAGKTNIVEAVQLVTSLESFRRPKWDEVVQAGRQMARVEARIADPQRDLVVALGVGDGQRRYFLNGKARPAAELRGILPAVVFTPDDLKLAKGSAETRRNAVDSAGAQISATYHDLKTRYGKAMRQKNALLQEQGEHIPDLAPWNEYLAAIGASFVRHRMNLFGIFRNIFESVWLELGKGLEISLLYIPSWEVNVDGADEDVPSLEQIQRTMLASMQQAKEDELAAGRSLVGPHRDEIRIALNGMDARKFASQGQQRMIALAWKITELKLIEQMCGHKPVLLLDDVMSELDRQKREILVHYLMGDVQTFITTTDIDNLDAKIIEKAKVFDIGSEHGA